jgi:shikimate dehydrogenase
VKLTYVIGWPVSHSKSPPIVNAAFAALGCDARMDALAVPPEQLAQTIAELRARGDVLGASVTVPHKEALVASCDELDASARAIGAVNCVAFVSGRALGHNTDAGGFRDALGFAPARAVLLGAGGAARAVHHALAGDRVVIARRTVAWTNAHPWTDAELRAAFERADLLVDCTSTGLDAATDAAFADALPLDALSPAARVATLVYHRDTRLLERARALGHPTLDGRAMLVHQAARAIALWTGRPAPIDVMTRALDAALAVKNA